MHTFRYKTYIIFLIFYFIFSIDIFSQTIKIYTSGGYQFHLKGATNEDPNIPNEYEHVKESASLSQYFDNNYSYNIGINYRFNNEKFYNIIIGFDFGKEKLLNSFKGSEIILGNNLSIISYTPYFGIGKFISEKRNYFLYGIIGLSFKNYEGKGKFNGIEVVNNYNDNTAIRIGVGMDIENNNNLPITFGFGIHLDIGSVQRDEVHFFYEGEKLGHAMPTGDIKLQDNTIGFKLSLKYQFTH